VEDSPASHAINLIERYNVDGYPKFIFERSLPSYTYGEAPVDMPVKDRIRRKVALKHI
jgi:hypothetical protein